MHLTTQASRIVIACGITSIVTLALLSLFIAARLERYDVFVKEELNRLENEFIRSAESADRTEVVASSTAAVFDCDTRVEFEDLLSRLSVLDRAHRKRLDEIFPQCADYYYRLKLYHIDNLARLKREYDLHLTNRSYLYASDPLRNERMDLMTQLIEKERDRAQAMHEQVVVQRDIIAALDTLVDRPELTTRSQLIGLQLGESDAVIDTLRNALVQSLSRS